MEEEVEEEEEEEEVGEKRRRGKNEKEEEVVRLIKEDFKQVEIANVLGVNQSTVSKLLKSARAKNLI